MDPFKVLGLPDTASFEEIRKRYKELAVKHHPDKGGDAEKFKDIAAAYEMVGSEAKLKQYRSRGTLQWDTTFDSIFRDFFGRGHGPTQMRRAAYVTLNIQMEEAFNGGIKPFMYRIAQTCDNCGGLGAVSFHPNGQPKTICQRCQGAGTIAQLNEAEIEIPKGIQDGATVVAKSGDVYVTFHVLPHPVFERRGVDTHSTIDVPLIKVFDGSKIVVNTLHGPVEVSIPRCVQNDQSLRVKSRGFYDSRKNGYGDHIIKVKVTIPKLSEEDCETIAECLNGIQTKKPTPT